ncbi:MAG: group 1 truncated hemoglobin, partial [Rhodoglobus sp.]
LRSTWAPGPPLGGPGVLWFAVPGGTNQGVTPRSWDVADQGVDAESIRDAVDLFYERVLADPSLVPAFDTSDLPRLRMHQRSFILQALGGPSLYAGRDIQVAHAGLAITPAQFERALELLIASLRDVGVAPDVVDRAAADVEALRALIVSAV